MTPHVREWDLRRLVAGELGGEEASSLRAHLAECEGCRATEHALADAQRRFEAALPFEEFARGVERMLRPPKPRSVLSGHWLQGGIALAACVGLAVLAPRVIALAEGDASGARVGQPVGNRLKGGAEVELRIAGANGGPQRVASARGDEALAPGERVRIGYRAGTHRYVAAISVDEHGEVSALYPEAGKSLAAEASPRMTYLPGSLEFTGHGRQKVIIVLSDAPLELAQLTRAAQDAFRKAGQKLAALPALEVPGQQFQRTLLEP